MSVALVRVDDRLVHGQVVEGWVKSLRINHVVVASDRVAADEMQMALYMLAVPQGIQLTCLPVTLAAQQWQKGLFEKDNVLILVSGPADVVALQNAGAPLKSVNVGGIHFREGRVQILKAISLDDADAAALQSLLAKGVALEARPLPLDEPIDLKSYLDRWSYQRQTLGDQPR